MPRTRRNPFSRSLASALLLVVVTGSATCAVHASVAKLGFDVVAVSDLREAFDGTRPPSLAIIELDDKAAEHAATLRQWQGEHWNQSFPILGTALSESQARGADGQLDALLTKPLEFSRVAAEIWRQLGADSAAPDLDDDDARDA